MPIRTVRELMAASPHNTEPVTLDFTSKALTAAGTALAVVGSNIDPTPYPLSDSWLFGEIDVADWSALHFGLEWDNVTAGVITLEGKVSAGDLRWTPVYLFQDNATATSAAGTTTTPTANATHRYTADVSPYKMVRMRVSTAIPAAATTFKFGLQRAYYFLSSRHESNRKGNASAITSSTVTLSSTTVTHHNAYGVALGAGTTAWPTAVARTLKSASSRAIINVYLRNYGTAPIFVRLYDKATAPVATDIPLMTLVAEPGEEILKDFGASGIWCPTGVGYAITGGMGDTDNTAPPAGGVFRMKTAAA